MDLTHNEINENENVVGLSGSGIKKGRKTIKNKIGFHLSLNDEQKHIKSDALTDTVSVFLGKAGSGIHGYLPSMQTWRCYRVKKKLIN